MPRPRKTWRQKLEADQEPRLIDTPKGKMLIPRPLDVDALIRRVPEGKLITDVQLRDRLAKDRRADYACPLTTGIFVWIASETSEEDRAQGRFPVTPYWRLVKADGCLNPRYPGGTDAQAERLRGEGHTVEPGKGKKPPRVKDFEKRLYLLSATPYA